MIRVAKMARMRCKKKLFWTVAISLLLYVLWITFLHFLQGHSRGDSQFFASRNLRQYVSGLRPHFYPEDFCKRKGLLLVTVFSRPEDFDRRGAIRETWGRTDQNAQIIFLLGESRDDDVLKTKLAREAYIYGDTIQERFVDSYYNLSIKSVNMLKLFTLHCASSFKFLMKSDDDTFVNLHKITKMLAKRENSTDLLLGKLRTGLVPFRSKSSKWYMPYELYPEDKYPPFLCGPGYIMSADVVQKLYEQALHTAMIHIEDLFITGICAKLAGITPEDHSLFTCNQLRGSICCNQRYYTLHYYSAKDMRKSYKTLIDGCLSRWAVIQRFSLLYCKFCSWISPEP